METVVREMPDALEEECGVFGVYAPGEDVARLTGYGLQALQHRGQESAGIAVGDGAHLSCYKNVGLVTQVFDDAVMDALVGDLAVGHVRYSTSGAAASRDAAQPHLSSIDEVEIALVHNGTLLNTEVLRASLEEEGATFASGTDTEVATRIIAEATRRTGSVREGIRHAMEVLEGAYAMILATPEALYAFRDPHGIRPLCIGRLPQGGWVVSSETCGLDIAGAAYVRDVEPAEVVRLGRDGLDAEQGPAAPPASSNTCTSPAPTASSTGRACTKLAAPWGRSCRRRRPSRPTWCSAYPTRERRRRWAMPRPVAFPMPSAS